MDANRDTHFGTLAVDRGYLNEQQVAEAREAQKVMKQQLGVDQSLDQILVGKGILTADQAQDLNTAVSVKTGEARIVAGYEVVSRLGAGGMGAVYKARKIDTGQFVALKILPPSMANQEMIARFKRESEVVAKLTHENIMGFVEFGLDEKRKCWFCALELVEGQDLLKVIKEAGKVDEARAVSITSQIASGLQHAYQNGLVHRDVKPENIMVTPTGTAKLLDLGLARDAGVEATRVTQSGMFIGSPYYASPEQALGESDIDVRSDIYSLGASLYHMLTGSPPFGGTTVVAILQKHVTEKLPWPADVNPGISDGLCRVIAKMMAKKPENRFQEPRQVIAALECVSRGERPEVGDTALAGSTIARAGLKGKPRGDRPSGRARRATQKAEAVSPGKSSAPVILAVAGVVVALVAGIALFAGGDAPEKSPVVPAAPPVVKKKAPPSTPTARSASRDADTPVSATVPAATTVSPDVARADEPATPPADPAPAVAVAPEPVGVPAASEPEGTMSVAPEVPDDAVGFAGHSYRVYRTAKTWNAARRYCAGLGGHLATVTSAEEHAFVVSLVRPLRADAWIGLGDVDRDGTYEWVTGEPLRHTEWRPNEPSGSFEGAPETVVELFMIGDWAWNDVRAQKRSVFVCEWDVATAKEAPADVAARDVTGAPDVHGVSRRKALDELCASLAGAVRDGAHDEASWAVTAKGRVTEDAVVKEAYVAAGRVITALQARDVAVRAAVEALRGTKVELETTKGTIAGKLSELSGDGFVVLKQLMQGRRVAGEVRMEVKWRELMPAQRSALARKGSWAADTPDAAIALALIAMGRGETAAVSAALAKHGDHALAAPLQARLDAVALTAEYVQAVRTARSAARAKNWRKVREAARRALEIRPDDADARELASLAAARLAPKSTITVGLGKGVTMEFIYVEPGSFMMGDATTLPDHRPVHRVTITRGFYLGKYEVTNEQLGAVEGVRGIPWDDPRLPAAGVSWDNAVLFCRLVSERAKMKVRLPTEAEWEYASRAGADTFYCFGNDHLRLDGYGWHKANSGGKAHAVGGKKPNAWGFCDMHGNHWEWVADRFGATYYAESPAEDPMGPQTGGQRILRGGSWFDDHVSSRSGFRFTGPPDKAGYTNWGFRVAITVGGSR